MLYIKEKFIKKFLYKRFDSAFTCEIFSCLSLVYTTEFQESSLYGQN